MTDDFVVARNPDEASTLPFLVRIPLGPLGVVLKVRDTWPRTNKVDCHRADGWAGGCGHRRAGARAVVRSAWRGD
jgi:hypothetical protein